MFSVLLYVMSGHWRSTRRVLGIRHYLSLVSTVVRRFSIVLICFAFHHIFLSLVYRWFADEVGLCDLALHLWQHKNFVWLFEHVTPG
jgi:amino acid permease